MTLRAPPEEVTLLRQDDGELRYTIGGVQRRALIADDGVTLHLAIVGAVNGAVFTFTEPSPWPLREQVSDPGRARAPVAGVVAQVRVAPGDTVTVGQQLVCVEAMKMEMWLTASAAGTVRAVHARLKDSVAAGTVLVELEVSE